MLPRRVICVFACLLAAAAPLAGCGDDSGSSGSGPDAEATSRPAPPKSAFPSAAGKTLQEVVKEADAPAPLVVSPAGMVFYKGENRFSFGVFEPDRSPVSDAEVALYVSKAPRTKPGVEPGKEAKGAAARAQKEALEAPAQGPFPASIESLQTELAFRAQTTTSDPNAAAVAYSTMLAFPSEGEWRIAALIREDGELTAALLPSIIVGEFDGIPRPGDDAPLIHTPTAEDAGGDLSEITTRVPPDTQNRADFADVLGRKPIVLLFATPQFCESRVCGPVVDVAEQVKEEHGGEAEFIHMEIWKDNDPSTKRTRPQVRAYELPTEPWLFVIDRGGKVSTAIEGPFGVERLTRAVEEVTGG
ncbi:MAG TPA: hypothetical protein VEQ41_07880 [Solirubrobacterales bacterium]|nr:hypothetical protein [Solirubrobacterales bacterium]